MACVELCNVDADGSHVNIKGSVCVIRSYRKCLQLVVCAMNNRRGFLL